MISVHPPSGFRDFLNQEAKRRLFLMNQISTVYQSFGFLPLETPVVENLDLLVGGGGGEENEKLIFKILKRGDKLAEALPSGDENRISEFGLRFDLTLPLSRVVALHRGKIQMPWKVFHIGPVWRAERAQKGRYREFIQCDVDIIGAKGIGAEVEVIQAAAYALESVGASGFELRINDRRLIQAMAEKFGFTGSKVDSFAVILDKKDKLEMPALLEQLTGVLGHPLSVEVQSVLEGQMTLDQAVDFHAVAGNDLKTLVTTLQALSLPLTRIVFDPSLVRGMGYYTGPVFELRHSSAGYSFGGGGRYDRLVGRLSGQEIPACGISIGFERLVLLLAELEQQNQSDSQVLFFPVFDESLRARVCSLAAELRSLGLCVDVFPDAAKIKNQFRFASEQGYRWVLVAGETEWSQGVFKLKDFKSGEELEVPAADLKDHVLKLFSQSKKS